MWNSFIPKGQPSHVSCHLVCRLPAVAICVVCNQHYCWNHFCEHRRTFEEHLNQAQASNKSMSECLNEFQCIEEKLNATINDWENRSIENIHQQATAARQNLHDCIQTYRSSFEEEYVSIVEDSGANREGQLINLERIQKVYGHSLESIRIIQNYNQEPQLIIEKTSPLIENSSPDRKANLVPSDISTEPTTRLGKRLTEKPLIETSVGHFWAIGASDEYLMAQEYENKQLTLFDRYGRRGISMIWYLDIVIRDIQWNSELRRFFILLDKKLILFDPVTRLYQEVSQVKPFESNTFRRCTCRNNRLFISNWCQESAIELYEISSWSFSKRWWSPETCRANELIACIQLNSKDQLALSIQDENNPFNRQFRFEIRDCNLNILRTLLLETDSGIFSRMTPLPDDHWALLNVDNDLVFIVDENGVLIDKVKHGSDGPLHNIALIGKHTIVIRAIQKLLFYNVEFDDKAHQRPIID